MSSWLIITLVIIIIILFIILFSGFIFFIYKDWNNNLKDNEKIKTEDDKKKN